MTTTARQNRNISSKIRYRVSQHFRDTKNSNSDLARRFKRGDITAQYRDAEKKAVPKISGVISKIIDYFFDAVLLHGNNKLPPFMEASPAREAEDGYFDQVVQAARNAGVHIVHHEAKDGSVAPSASQAPPARFRRNKSATPAQPIVSSPAPLVTRPRRSVCRKRPSVSTVDDAGSPMDDTDDDVSWSPSKDAWTKKSLFKSAYNLNFPL